MAGDPLSASAVHAAASRVDVSSTEFWKTARHGLEAGAPVRTASGLTAFQEFEAYLLQSVLQSILPQNSEAIYGRGFAGDTWKSILAEKLAIEVARSGSLGIAARLEASAGQRTIQNPSETLRLPVEEPIAVSSEK